MAWTPIRVKLIQQLENELARYRGQKKVEPVITEPSLPERETVVPLPEPMQTRLPTRAQLLPTTPSVPQLATLQQATLPAVDRTKTILAKGIGGF